jgi:dGTPase
VEEKYIFHDALQAMQKTLILDLIRTTQANVLATGANTLDDIRECGQRLAVFSMQAESERLEEKRYLYDTLYTCPDLEREHSKAQEVVTGLFDFWMNYPEELPESYGEEVETEGLPRVVADYIAGMTDDFILLQYANMRRKVRFGAVHLVSSR